MEIFLKEGGAVVLYSQPLRQYFTGFKSSFGIAVISQNAKYLICDDRYLEAAIKLADADVIRYTPEALRELITLIAPKKIGAVLGYMTAKEYLELEAFKIPVEDVSEKIFEITAVKSGKSLKSIKKACKIAEKAFKESLGSLRAGITEREFSKILENNMIKLGADGLSFDIIAAFGKNSSVPHHMTGATKLKDNMPVLADFGCRVDGWCSDMTRTVFFGEPTRKYLDAYINVLNAHESAALFIEEGMQAYHPDLIAREMLKSKGLDKYFTHSLGHGLGLEIHEAPYLKKGSQATLKEGAAFTIEPGVYFNNKFGIRIEDTYIMQGGRAKSLMTFTKNPLYIKNGEIKTVKTYKATVSSSI